MATQGQAASPATAPAHGPPVDVDVWAWIDKRTKEVKFDHTWKVDGNAKPGKRIDIPPGQNATAIRFKLVEDKTGLDLEFYSNPADAMWVDFAPDCPKMPGNAGQISFESSSPKMLRVVDANYGRPCDLKYSLRFYGKSATIGGVKYEPPYEYDPDLKNGGGGIDEPMHEPSGGWGGGIAMVAALAAIGFIAFLMFRD